MCPWVYEMQEADHRLWECICSPQFANLCNFEIALRKLEIVKLQTDFKIANQFRNCAAKFMRDFEIALRK